MFKFCANIPTNIIAIIAIIVVVHSCSNEDQMPAHELPLDKIMPGDIAFRRGEGLVSDMVLFNDADGKYSHIGVIVLHNDSLKVVHAVPGENDTPDDFDRVKIDRIADFFSNKKAIKGEIMRIAMTDSQRQIITSSALQKAMTKIEFDHNYNLEDTTKLYCTELVQLLFSNAGIDLAEGRVTKINCPGLSRKYIMPSDIYKNKDLERVCFY